MTRDERVVLVTGAGSGIGARAVQRLRAAGADVVATDVDPTGLTPYADDPGVLSVVGDISADGVAESLVEQAVGRHGRLDTVIHCAGIMPGGRVRDVDTATVTRVMQVNYTGTVRVVEAVLPHMRARRSGQVVVLGSMVGFVPSQRFAAYSASKAAVNSYVEILAREERGSGVHVMLVAPSAVKTPLLAQATGGPTLVARLDGSASSWLMTTPDAVLDQVDRGLARGRTLVQPGGRAGHLLRRLSPGAAWWLADRLDR